MSFSLNSFHSIRLPFPWCREHLHCLCSWNVIQPKEWKKWSRTFCTESAAVLLCNFWLVTLIGPSDLLIKLCQNKVTFQKTLIVKVQGYRINKRKWSYCHRCLKWLTDRDNTLCFKYKKWPNHSAEHAYTHRALIKRLGFQVPVKPEAESTIAGMQQLTRGEVTTLLYISKGLIFTLTKELKVSCQCCWYFRRLFTSYIEMFCIPALQPCRNLTSHQVPSLGLLFTAG